MRPGEFWGRVRIVIVCILAVAFLALGSGGCASNGDIAPSCESACRVVGLRAAPRAFLDFGMCSCERLDGGTVSR